MFFHSKPKKLIALFSYRFDFHLVPDLLKNIDFVDDYISLNDRESKEIWYHEGNYRRNLIEQARKKKADWVFCIDPDERIEKRAGEKIRKIIKTNKKIIFGFNFRELFTPNSFRIDGIWGKKKNMFYSLYCQIKFLQI